MTLNDKLVFHNDWFDIWSAGLNVVTKGKIRFFVFGGLGFSDAILFANLISASVFFYNGFWVLSVVKAFLKSSQKSESLDLYKAIFDTAWET